MAASAVDCGIFGVAVAPEKNMFVTRQHPSRRGHALLMCVVGCAYGPVVGVLCGKWDRFVLVGGGPLHDTMGLDTLLSVWVRGRGKRNRGWLGGRFACVLHSNTKVTK